MRKQSIHCGTGGFAPLREGRYVSTPYVVSVYGSAAQIRAATSSRELISIKG